MRARAIADVMNRVRSPSTSISPAQAAGVAALEDVAAVDRARAHNDIWRPWLERELTALGLGVTPSVANFVLVRFPARQRTARCGLRLPADRAASWRASRGLWIARASAHHHRPRRRDARGGRRARRFPRARHERAASSSAWRSSASASSARRSRACCAATKAGAARSSLATRRSETLDTAQQAAASPTKSTARSRGRGRRRRSRRHRDAASRPMPRSAGASRRRLRPARILTDVGSVKGAVVRDLAPTAAAGRAFRARPSRRRHRAFGPRGRASPSCSRTAGAS